MVDEKSFNKIAGIVILIALIILTFLILKPILVSSIFALVLAFIFHPLYRWVVSKIKNQNLSALIICLILIAIIVLPLIFFLPMLIRQSFEAYSFIQGEDFLTPIYEAAKKIFPSEDISTDLIVAINSFTSKVASSFLNSLSDTLLDSPKILLHLVLILFVFFFGLRDGEKLVAYIQSLSPLSKESEKKIFKQFKDITQSVIFGQIIVGLAQGIVTGIALFAFQIPNALVLTLLAAFVGILPIIGPWLVWVPADIYLFATGRTGAAFGMLIYGLIVISWIDNIIRPFIVSKKTKINSAVILVSMLGGLFVFGVLGLILGPLIIAYLILILESYRASNKKTASLIMQTE